MKNKIIGIILIIAAVFSGVLCIRSVQTKGDGDVTALPYVEDSALLASYEGQTVIAVGRFRAAGRAVDEETGLAFQEPFVARKCERETESVGNYEWKSDDITDKYIYAGISFGNVLLTEEMAIPLMGNEEAYPTEDSMASSGFGIYTFGTDTKEYVCPDVDGEGDGYYTGRIRYYYRAVSYDTDSEYTLVVTVKNGELGKPDLALSNYIFEGRRKPEEISASESKSSTGTIIFTAVLALGLLAGGIFLLIKK